MDTQQPCKITILEIEVNHVWIRGFSKPYTFEAKVYCTGSQYGIDNGRISKFAVWIEARNRRWLAHYDRGWEVRPQEEHEAAVNRFIGLLEAMPEPEALVENQVFELD